MKQKILMGCGIAAAIWMVLCIFSFIFLAVVGQTAMRQIREEKQEKITQVQNQLDSANSLWNSGKQEESVEILENILVLSRGSIYAKEAINENLPNIYRRVIDYRVKIGGVEAGRSWIEQALEQEVNLSLSTPEANEFVAQVREEQRTGYKEHRTTNEYESMSLKEINAYTKSHWWDLDIEERDKLIEAQIKAEKNDPEYQERMRRHNERINNMSKKERESLDRNVEHLKDLMKNR